MNTQKLLLLYSLLAGTIISTIAMEIPSLTRPVQKKAKRRAWPQLQALFARGGTFLGIPTLPREKKDANFYLHAYLGLKARTDQNIPRAIFWHSRLIINCHIPSLVALSQLELADIYRTACNDLISARFWLNLSVDQEANLPVQAWSNFWLGKISPDTVEAKKYFLKAAGQQVCQPAREHAQYELAILTLPASASSAA